MHKIMMPTKLDEVVPNISFGAEEYVATAIP